MTGCGWVAELICVQREILQQTLKMKIKKYTLTIKNTTYIKKVMKKYKQI